MGRLNGHGWAAAGRLQSLATGRSPWRCTRLQSQVREDVLDYRHIQDRRDDLELAAVVRAMLLATIGLRVASRCVRVAARPPSGVSLWSGRRLQGDEFEGADVGSGSIAGRHDRLLTGTGPCGSGSPRRLRGDRPLSAASPTPTLFRSPSADGRLATAGSRNCSPRPSPFRRLAGMLQGRRRAGGLASLTTLIGKVRSAFWCAVDIVFSEVTSMVRYFRSHTAQKHAYKETI